MPDPVRALALDVIAIWWANTSDDHEGYVDPASVDMRQLHDKLVELAWAFGEREDDDA
jgi:hypothetical protein